MEQAGRPSAAGLNAGRGDRPSPSADGVHERSGEAGLADAGLAEQGHPLRRSSPHHAAERCPQAGEFRLTADHLCLEVTREQFCLGINVNQPPSAGSRQALGRAPRRRHLGQPSWPAVRSAPPGAARPAAVEPPPIPLVRLPNGSPLDLTRPTCFQSGSKSRGPAERGPTSGLMGGQHCPERSSSCADGNPNHPMTPPLTESSIRAPLLRSASMARASDSAAMVSPASGSRSAAVGVTSTNRTVTVLRSLGNQVDLARRVAGTGASRAGSWFRTRSCSVRSSGPGSTPSSSISVSRACCTPPRRRPADRPGRARGPAARVGARGTDLCDQVLELRYQLAVHPGSSWAPMRASRAASRFSSSGDGCLGERLIGHVGQR